MDDGLPIGRLPRRRQEEVWRVIRSMGDVGASVWTASVEQDWEDPSSARKTLADAVDAAATFDGPYDLAGPRAEGRLTPQRASEIRCVSVWLLSGQTGWAVGSGQWAVGLEVRGGAHRKQSEKPRRIAEEKTDNRLQGQPYRAWLVRVGGVRPWVGGRGSAQRLGSLYPKGTTRRTRERAHGRGARVPKCQSAKVRGVRLAGLIAGTGAAVLPT
ncbi:hypothetical protein K490DRAFT_57400 [Saccharata proteae CBS 121410]|uniref:Uncharacterized protein n=1 Tax=Saccharata proteae CBS 121410 TaxID=1314787 RepID=A0A9P4HU72_9PEZI|nr:hypothetical protein K490DRAFT_57400 [Saccharata proteae CBS 121410]